MALAVALSALSVTAGASASGLSLPDSPPQEPPETTLPPNVVSGSVQPNARNISEGFEEYERREEAAKKLLERPAAVEARQTSRFAYIGHDSPSEVAALIRSTFAEEFASINQDPARFLSDARIEKSLGPDVARVSSDGESSLLDAGIPLRAENESGLPQKVDLTLQETTEGYEPTNPLVDLHISDSAAEGIALDVNGEDIVIKPAGVEGHLGSGPFGTKNALFANIDTDRDLIVAPIARGVETFDQLRSFNSPELLRYEVELPPQSILRSNGNGGAEIVQDGTTLVHIPFPTAVDAQGSPVPVALSVEAESITLRVAHRDEPVAYPVLVDPVYELAESWYWYGGSDLGALSDGTWQWGSNAGWAYGSTSCIYACWGSGRGLFISAPNGNFAGNEFGQWTYTPPGGTSYVTGAYLNPSGATTTTAAKPSTASRTIMLGLGVHRTTGRTFSEIEQTTMEMRR